MTDRIGVRWYRYIQVRADDVVRPLSVLPVPGIILDYRLRYVMGV